MIVEGEIKSWRLGVPVREVDTGNDGRTTKRLGAGDNDSC